MYIFILLAIILGFQISQHGSTNDPYGNEVPLDELGNKVDPTGKSIDDFLRSFFPGALPTSTQQEFAAAQQKLASSDDIVEHNTNVSSNF
jgi:hypothetical protein